LNALERMLVENMPPCGWTERDRELLRLAWNSALSLAARISDSQKATWVAELIRKEQK
jgi:hypothetical protein